MPPVGNRFRPGQSGNPTGRPKTAGLVKRLRKRYGDDAKELLEQLHALACGPHDNPGIRLAAIRELLNRGWGIPVQPVELAGEDGGPVLTNVVHEYHEAA